MALQTKVGSITQRTTTGSQATTGIGFQPKALFLWGNNETLDGSGAATDVLAEGFAASPTARAAICYYASDGPDNAGGHSDTKVYSMISNTGAVLAAADLTSFDVDGFTLNFTSADATARIINYLAIGGNDVTQAGTLELTSPGATGNQSYIGLGFKPDCVLLLTMGLTTAPGTNNATNGFRSMGFGVNPNQRATCASSSNAARELTNKILTMINTAGTLQLEADLVSMDQDGFTLNWTNVTLTGAYVFALCLKGGQYAVGSDTKPTSITSKATKGIGFKPTGVLFQADAATVGLGTGTSSDHTTAAASGPTARAYCAYSDDNGVSHDEILSRTNALAMYEGGGSLSSEAGLTSFDTDGFTLNWTTSDANAKEFLYLVFGSQSKKFTGRNNLKPRPFSPGIPR